MGQKMAEHASIYIALGGNLPFEGGVPQETQCKALQSLRDAGITIVQQSSFWTSPAWPDPAKPDYVNAMAEIASPLPAEALLSLLLETEEVYGRERQQRWDSRTLDLDLVDYRGRVSTSDDLTLPHPRAHERAFVLLPLAEIAPDWCHPVSNTPIGTLIGLLDPRDVAQTRKLA
jgi:2-amino-4-hydroxy-6-hydroxymethyldihydropteridine diphosphokinase